MIKHRLAGALAVITLLSVSACANGIDVPEMDSVAIIVLDKFTADRRVRQTEPTTNCPYTGLQANEVGSGGGGDGLPPGISHGQAVYEVIQDELNRPDWHLNPIRERSAVGHDLVQARFVNAWRHGDHRVFLIGVDTRDYNTRVIAAELDRLLGIMRQAFGVSRFVLNMSFLVLPCDIAGWLESAGSLDDASLRRAYAAVINSVPELSDLRDRLAEIERLSRQELLGREDLARARDVALSNMFHSRLRSDGAMESIGRVPTAALPRSFAQINDDALKSMLVREETRVIAVGAAGNGIIVPGPDPARPQLVQVSWPFAPAMWDSVVSVSASDPADRSKRAGYSNGGEIMMEATNRHRAAGTSFAAPRMSALQAIYLLTGGPAVCDAHRPPLGYANVNTDPAPQWNNLWLSAYPADNDPALKQCEPEFWQHTRMSAPRD